MAYPRTLSLSVFIQFLIIANLLSFSSAIRVSSSAPKVKLALYYESLCPYCSRFIVNYLNQIFDGGLINIIDLNLVPYGNARVGPNNIITCQHGPYECLLNEVEACAISVWPDLNKHFAFILCVERFVVERKYKEWESCFEQLELDPKPISDCYKGELGKKLELQYANETNALEPPHRYVPWVTVDGQPLHDDYEDFVSFVCRAYKGPLPKACHRCATLEITKETVPKQIPEISHTEKTSITTTETIIRSSITSSGDQMKMDVI